MFDKYIQTKTYSVTISLSVLDKHIDSELREILLKETHVNSLDELQVRYDLLDGGITFYSIETSEV